MTKQQNGKTKITAITNIDQAKANGYTIPVFAEGDWYTLELLVKPTAALDEEFEAFDCEENQMVKVNGWLFTTHTE